MIRHEFQQALLKQVVTVSTILWGGMVTSPLILAGVLTVSSRTWGDPREVPGIVTLVFLLLAGSLALVYLMLRPRVLQPERLVAGSTSAAAASGEGLKVAPEHPEEIRAITVAQRFLTTNIITWALADAVGVLGFALTLLTRDIATGYIVIACSCVLVMLGRPSKSLLDEAIRRSETMTGVL